MEVLDCSDSADQGLSAAVPLEQAIDPVPELRFSDGGSEDANFRRTVSTFMDVNQRRELTNTGE